jgi:hypothetical protein
MRTVVGLFDTFDHAQSVVRDLEASGFPRSDISLVAHTDIMAHGRGHGTATGAGTAIGAGLGLLAGLAVIAVPGIGVVAALGPIIAGGLMGAVAGGLVGSLVDAGVPAEEAEYYSEGVRRGGTLVTVAAKDDDAPRAIEIISRQSPVDLNERVLQWREAGWMPKTTAGRQATASTSSSTHCDRPDPTGHTTMGDAAAAMPRPGEQTAATASSKEWSSGASANPRSAVAFDDMEEQFREDFEQQYPGGTYSWDECGPAYRYGCEIACECEGADWDSVEPQVKRRWETEHPGTWDRIKDAARFAYDRAKSKV